MLRDTDVTEGYHRRKYPDGRKGRDSVTYLHSGNPAGRVFLIYVQLIAEKIVGGATAHLFDRDFKAAGLTAQKLYDESKRLMPEYPAFYESHGGTFSPRMVYDRWHKKAVYQNGPNGTRGKAIPAQSNEHYSRSKHLRPIFPQVERHFRNGSVMSLRDMQTLGTP